MVHHVLESMEEYGEHCINTHMMLAGRKRSCLPTDKDGGIYGGKRDQSGQIWINIDKYEEIIRNMYTVLTYSTPWYSQNILTKPSFMGKYEGIWITMQEYGFE